MRTKCIGLGLGLALCSSAAMADPVLLKPGNWRSTVDTIFTGTIFGEAVQIDPESTDDTECWDTEEALSLDPAQFQTEECTLGDSTPTPFGIEAPMSCRFDTFRMEGTLRIEANLELDAFYGRMTLESIDDGFDLEAVTLFLGQLEGPCTAHDPL